ncbi:oligopeptide:H+ symporter [Legionella adelaidensis]|uniref:oligopeptide:H+ symporter n=1 Tax=Legionella adelaidensis TaxID=45056 RepID=UPI001041951A|nr:oligopeptide:H+ symporter [Legionella adelaidensis]
MLNLFHNQPRPFYMIFLLEVWERFGYYTVQGILTLFFIRSLGFDQETAYFTFGAFSALVYGLISVGGFLGDKVLGTKRTILLGLVTLAAGYLSLSLVGKEYIFLALGLVCVGNGLFKANPSSLLAKCYEEKDPRLHGGFTLYYMAINLGSIFALFIGPALSSKFGYSYAFFTSFIGILLGIVNYFWQRSSIAHIQLPADNRPISFWQWSMVIAGIIATVMGAAYLLQHVMIAKNLVWFIVLVVVTIYLAYMRKENRLARLRMLVAIILMIEGVTFFTLYQQMPTSLNLFAVNNVRSSFFGISLDPQSFQALNPIWIIIMSPVIASFYQKLYRKGKVISLPYKFSIGMTFCAVSFLVLYFSRYFHDAHGMISCGWLVASYFFQSISEILISALGVAMVAELVPLQITGFVMGMWFLSSAISGFLGAQVASFTALPKDLTGGFEGLFVYTQVFAYIGGGTLLIALLMWITSPFLTRLLLREAF